MVRRGLAEGQPQEFLEGQPVVDLVFQLGIGGDTKPFLQQQAFEQQDGRIRLGALLAGSDSIMLHENRFDTGPVNGSLDLFHQFDAAIGFQGAGECEIGEIQPAAHLLESHAILRCG